jgi:hypothetical protein
MEADIHKHFTTSTNIHKQSQGKTLIPTTDLHSEAALDMPEADPADSMLKASFLV